MTDNPNEYFPIVDTNGNTIGKISRSQAHDGSKTLHPVVHLHVYNSHGGLFLQKRPQWKDIQPGRWDTACGGHVAYGEDVRQALRREVEEELGITSYEPMAVDRYVFESAREKEQVNIFRTYYDEPIFPNKEELDGGRFWTEEEINEALGTGVFTPNFEQEYTRFHLHRFFKKG